MQIVHMEFVQINFETKSWLIEIHVFDGSFLWLVGWFNFPLSGPSQLQLQGNNNIVTLNHSRHIAPSGRGHYGDFLMTN